MNIDELVVSIKEHEGFEGMPYRDTKGFLTVGYGTKLPLTRKEGTVLLRMRMHDMIDELSDRWPPLHTMPEPVQRVLVEMAYQMGVTGLMSFRMMLLALEKRDWKTAAKEGLDSEWAKQTPGRAERLMSIISEARQL